MATYRTAANTYTIQQVYYGSTGAATNTAGFTDFGAALLPGTTDPGTTVPVLVLQPAWTALEAAVVTDIRPVTGVSSLGLAGSGAVAKAVRAAGAATLGLAGKAAPGKVVRAAGVAALGLSGDRTTPWGPPGGLTVTPVSDTQINLSWTAAPAAAGYDIERNGVVIATDVAATTYSDTGLTASTTYTYRARSVRA